MGKDFRKAGRPELVGLAASILIGFLGLLPILLLALWSFAQGWFWPALLPGGWTLRSWRYIFSASGETREALLSSLGIAVIVAGLALAMSWPAARLLALRRFRWRSRLFFLILLPVLAPPLASTMGMHLLFLRYGLADTVVGVVLAHLVPAVSYAIMVLIGSFSRLDQDLEAQARTLGAGRFQVWRYVTVPMLRPGLAVAGAFAFLISWAQYLTTLIIGGGRVQTLPLILVAFQRGGDQSMAAALSLVFLVPVVGLFVLVSHLMMRERLGDR